MRIDCLLFALVICFISMQALAQPVEISSDEYWKTYTDALIKSRAFRKRHKEIMAWYKSGVLSERWTSTFEEDADGNIRFISETLEGKKRTITESIKFNYVEYCRVNGGPWKQVSDCHSRGISLKSYDGDNKEKFTREYVSIGDTSFSLLRAYTTISLTDTTGKKTGKTAFNENKIWISADNSISKREYVSGFLPKKVEHTVTESYEYNVQIPTIRPPL